MTGTRAPRPGGAEFAGFVLILLIVSQALYPMLLASPENPEGHPVLRLLWIPLYVVFLGAASLRAWDVLRLAAGVPAVIVLSLLALASAFWSIDPGLTARRGIALVMTSLLGLVLASRFDWRDLLRLLGITWLILGLGSLLAGLFVPSIGRMAEVHVGAWQGLWWEKNTLGGFMSRASLIFAVLVLGDRGWRGVWAFGFLLSVFLVAMSTSKTALLGTVLGMAVVAAGLIVRRGPRLTLVLGWVAGLAVAGVAGAFILSPQTMLDLLGRDMTLTGRTQIWQALGGAISERPWTGYGYGAFWELGSAPGDAVRRLVQWDAPTAHNGWIEVMLAVGPAGVVLFAISALVVLGRGLAAFARSWGGLYAIGFLAQFLLFSISESVIIQQHSLLWATYVAVAARLGAKVSAPAALPLRGRVETAG